MTVIRARRSFRHGVAGLAPALALLAHRTPAQGATGPASKESIAAGTQDSAQIAAALAERLLSATPQPAPGSPATAVDRAFVAGGRQPHDPPPPRAFERYVAAAFERYHVHTVEIASGAPVMTPALIPRTTLGVSWAVASAHILGDTAVVRAYTTLEYVPRPSTFSVREVEYVFGRTGSVWRFVRERERTISDGALGRS